MIAPDDEGLIGLALDCRESFIKPPSMEESLVGCVLLDIGGFSFLSGVRMMFMLYAFLLRFGRFTGRYTLVASIAWRNGGHVARHGQFQVGEGLKTNTNRVSKVYIN